MLPINQVTKKLTTDEITKLYQFVNKGRDWKINIKTHELVDKIIELWFKSQGYDFWYNPYPEVTEWTIDDNNEITFTYITN